MPEEDRRLIHSDDELDARRKVTAFNIERAAKYTILILFITVSTVLVLVVLWMVITQKEWREFAIKSVLANLPGIAAVALVAIGLKKAD